MSTIITKIRERAKSKKQKDKGLVKQGSVKNSGGSKMGKARKKGKGESVPALVFDSESETESPWTCQICDTKFFDDESHVLECERCSDKYCRECLGIKASEYKFLTRRKDVHWFCDACDSIAKKSWTPQTTSTTSKSHMHDQVSKQLEDMRKHLVMKLENLETKLENKADESRVVEILQRHMKSNEIATGGSKGISTESLKTCPSQLPEEIKTQTKNDAQKINMSSEPRNYAEAARVNVPRAETSRNSKKQESESPVNEHDDITGIVRKVLEETKAKERNTVRVKPDDRERNIIIHRAPESDAENMQARKEDDTDFVMALCEVLQVDDILVERVFRLGPPKADHIRPLKVILGSVEDKAEFMSNLYQLRSAEDVFKGLSITNDLTQSEREENKILVQKAKEMTEGDASGEFVFRVRGPPWDRHIVKFKKQNL